MNVINYRWVRIEDDAWNVWQMKWLGSSYPLSSLSLPKLKKKVLLAVAIKKTVFFIYLPKVLCIYFMLIIHIV